MRRYRSGDTVGKRMGSTQGTNGHASKLPMLSDKRTGSRAQASSSAGTNADRIAAMRRQTSARSDAARTKAARESTNADLTEARVRQAREGASPDSTAPDSTASRVKAGREKAAKTASNDARIKDARSKYNARIKNAGLDARNGARKGPGVNGGIGNGLGGGTPIGVNPNAVTVGNVGGVWNNGHNNYYADPYSYYNYGYWNSWGFCYSYGWGGWFGGPFYCTGYWWHSYWRWGGSWGYPAYYYGPFLPASYSVVYYQEPEVIYVDAPAEELVEEEFIEEELAPAATNYGPEQPDPSLERELNRAAAYYLTQGDRAFRETRYGDAAHFYAKAVEFAPESGILYLVLSDALFATGDYRYAAYALRQALKREPSLASNVIDKRDFYADPSDFDRQLATLERFVEDHVLDTDARLMLAANYLFSQRVGAALIVFDNPFSEELRGTDEGQVLIQAALAVESGEPVEVEGPQEF